MLELDISFFPSLLNCIDPHIAQSRGVAHGTFQLVAPLQRNNFQRNNMRKLKVTSCVSLPTDGSKVFDK